MNSSIGVDDRHCFFWAVHTGAEIDLVVENGPNLLGFEFKRTLAPKATRSMHSAMETLGLAKLTVVYPGEKEFPLAESMVVKPLAAFRE